MSYLDEGFDQNLIRTGYSGVESEVVADAVNAEEIFSANSIPISQVTGALVSGQILNEARAFLKEVINDKLDTDAQQILQSFEFGASGAIQIGEYVNGVSGDIKISPAGIVARNSSGANTIAVDGEDGDVTILGTLAAGSVVACDISANYIVAGTFDEAMNVGAANVKIDGANKRIIINDGTNDRVLMGYLAGKF